MIKLENCPVCGTENTREYFYESIGLCEDYYDCVNCGYHRQMCYGPTLELINTLYPANDKNRKEEVLSRYKDKLSKLNIPVNPPEVEYI